MTAETTNPSPLTTRERLHQAMARVIPVLDELHYREYTIDDDALTTVDKVARLLRMPTVPTPESDTYCLDTELKPYERAQLLQAALGTASLQETQLAANEVSFTLHTVIEKWPDYAGYSHEDFYAAQAAVKAVWRATQPTE